LRRAGAPPRDAAAVRAALRAAGDLPGGTRRRQDRAQLLLDLLGRRRLGGAVARRVVDVARAVHDVAGDRRVAAARQVPNSWTRTVQNVRALMELDSQTSQVSASAMR
jgi:hypothetical protein